MKLLEWTLKTRQLSGQKLPGTAAPVPANLVIRYRYLMISVKLCACLALVWNSEGRSLKRGISSLDSTIIKQPIDTLKVSLPGGELL